MKKSTHNQALVVSCFIACLVALWWRNHNWFAANKFRFLDDDYPLYSYLRVYRYSPLLPTGGWLYRPAFTHT